MDRQPNASLTIADAIRWIRGIATAFSRSVEAEDLAQQTALRALTKAKADIRHPRAYLARIARNIVIDEARKVRVRGGTALALQDLDEGALPFSAPDQETALLLKQIILGLPPLYRDVFILNRFTGLTYEEIAHRYGITVKAVEYRMSRALALCQEALRD